MKTRTVFKRPTHSLANLSPSDKFTCRPVSFYLLLNQHVKRDLQIYEEKNCIQETYSLSCVPEAQCLIHSVVLHCFTHSSTNVSKERHTHLTRSGPQKRPTRPTKATYTPHARNLQASWQRPKHILVHTWAPATNWPYLPVSFCSSPWPRQPSQPEGRCHDV